MLTAYRPVPLVFGSERRLLERSGYTCEACGRPVVADPNRRVERIDQARGDADHHVRIVCGRCAARDRSGDDGFNDTASGDPPTSWRPRP
jgi:hypothetical protein